MHEKSPLPPNWYTSCFGSTPDISHREQSELGEHFTACQALRGRLHYLQSGADAVHGLVSARFVTCSLAVAAVVAVGFLAL